MTEHRMLEAEILQGPPDAPAATAKRRDRRAWRAVLAGNKPLIVASGVLGVLCLAALLGPLLWAKGANTIHLGAALQGVSAAHPMGTDELGRDVFARFLSGARLSLLIGFGVTIVGGALGSALGIVAGLATKHLEGLFGLIINSLLAFPQLLLAIAVAIALGAGVWPSAIGLAVAAVPWYARIIRSEVIRLRGTTSVESARALGASNRRIVGRHMIPHLVPTLVIQAASSFGWAILFMAGMGFVGLGAQPPTAEWGAMITTGLNYVLSGQWWLGVFPGIGLAIAVCAATVVADGLRDLLDPRGAQSRD